MPIIPPPAVVLSPPAQQSGTINVSGQVQGSDFWPGGLSGATQASRYVGATTSGAPASGTFAIGDYIVDRNGTFWICTAAGSPGTWTQVSSSVAFEYVLDGGGSPLATGAAGALVVPFAASITSCELLADQSGSLVLDIQKATYGGYPTSVSIVDSAPPTISSAQKSQDGTLTGWTTALAVGDILLYSVTSVSSITRCSVVLLASRT